MHNTININWAPQWFGGYYYNSIKDSGLSLGCVTVSVYSLLWRADISRILQPLTTHR